MKIGIYSPYVPKHFGGGEKYIFDVARCCVELGHSVSILLPNTVENDSKALSVESIKLSYEKFLGVSLANIEFIHSTLGTIGSTWSKLQFTKQFDVMYLVTDGSFFFSLASKNIVHIQIPFTQPQIGLMNRLKLNLWSIKNANSLFTKSVVEKAWQTQIPYIHYPMVDLPQAQYEPKKKEKTILSVGRFFDHLHSKRQDVLVSTFAELLSTFPKETKGWKLVLVGPAEDKEYAKQIAVQAKNLPIEIYHQASRAQLENFYQKASFYWHAAGYEVNELEHPEKVEHFGISTVEAMNFGCVPIVVGKGGQKEVLGSELKELLWQKQMEVVNLTGSLITNDEKRREYAELAVTQSKKFNKEKFMNTLQEMLK